MSKVFFIGVLFFLPISVGAQAEITLRPENPIQGEPVAIIVSGINSTSTISSATLGKQKLNFFVYNKEIMALYGIDLSAKVGTSTITVKLNNGNTISKDLVISKRPSVEASIDIPQKLGGNTPQAAKKLVTNLIDEQAIVTKITSVVRPKSFWKDKFVLPSRNPIVTDTYGYSRNTVGYQIAHKGTDFRAKIGDEVLAINRGVVRDVKVYPTFGRTIIVDHGFGLYSMYLHLSKAKVAVGQLVLPGQVIGLSGDSGYATGPHLHLTIRVGGVSIDPQAFYKIFGVNI